MKSPQRNTNQNIVLGFTLFFQCKLVLYSSTIIFFQNKLFYSPYLNKTQESLLQKASFSFPSNPHLVPLRLPLLFNFRQGRLELRLESFIVNLYPQSSRENPTKFINIFTLLRHFHLVRKKYLRFQKARQTDLQVFDDQVYTLASVHQPTVRLSTGEIAIVALLHITTIGRIADTIVHSRRAVRITCRGLETQKFSQTEKLDVNLK